MEAGIQLKVSSDNLKIMAEEVMDAISVMEREFQNLESVVNGSRGYWTGSAGNKGRKYFAEIKLDMNQVFKRLKEHPEKLMIMLGIYKGGEIQIIETVQSLPDDVIE